MAFIDQIIKNARRNPGTVILPEAEDDRTLQAAVRIEEQGIAKVALVGDRAVVAEKMEALGITREFDLTDPAQAPWLDEYVKTYFELRKKKGMTMEKAREVMLDPLAHGVMMLYKDKGDGLVAGACHSTGNTLRPALQILKTAPGCPIVSSFFFMTLGETTYLFADCALVENPDAEQLAEIALSTAHNAIAFGIDPKVAMLSYSTKGSARSATTEKVIEATRIAQERAAERFSPELGVVIDGELQFDAAFVPKVAASKAPDSPLAGQAKIFIFPDLNSANIGYKMVQRLAGAEAYGPVMQGMRLPVNDLSRGCSVADIVGVSAITIIQRRMMR